MALSPLSAPASPLSRQLLRYVSSGLAVALDRRAPPAITLPRVLESLDLAASQRLQITSRAASSPRGRPGAPQQGSGGKTNAVGAMATTARVVMRGLPARPGAPAQGSGGRVHSAPAVASVLMRGPAPPGPPAQGSGGKVHAVSPPAAMASVLMRGPAPPGPPAEGAGGRGGSIHAIAS